MKNNVVFYRYDVRKEKNKFKQIFVLGFFKFLKKRKIFIITLKQKYCDLKNSVEVKIIYYGIL